MKWFVIALLLMLLIWAPVHMLVLVPYVSDLVRADTISFGVGNLIGLYSSLIPLGLLAFAAWRSQ